MPYGGNWLYSRSSTGPHPIWFGPREQPLAGFLHRPSSSVTSGVLICPPFGYEATCAYRTLRLLADQLADHGSVVLRFDYAGTGASSGTGREPDLFERWCASVLEGVAELRRRGVTRPALIGVRLGALLTCVAASIDRDLGPVVLWAPVTSGRRYYRQLRAQAAATPGGGVLSDGSLNVFGHVLPASAATALKALSPLQDVDRHIDMLVLHSSDANDANSTATDFKTAGLEPTFVEAAGTAAMLERDAELSEVPNAALETIRCWLGSQLEQIFVACDPTRPDDPTRIFDSGAGVVEEQLVTISPRLLYGVLTKRPDVDAKHAVVFLNNGVAPAAGPSRAWVSFARALATHGICTLRFDFADLGDSPQQSRRPRRHLNPVPAQAGLDLLAVVADLRSRGIDRVTAVGLCSGAHIAVRTAAYDGDIDSVFAINAPLYSLADMGVGPWMRRFWKYTVFPMSKRRIRQILYHLPTRAWRILDKLALFPSPARYIRLAAERGTQVQLVFSEGDQSLRDIEMRAKREVNQLTAQSLVRIEVIEDMDHSMFDLDKRARVFAKLRDDVCNR